MTANANSTNKYLGDKLVELVQNQRHALLSDDVDGYLLLAEKRDTIMKQLESFIGALNSDSEREEIALSLRQVVGFDCENGELLAQLISDTKQGLEEVRESRVMLSAYSHTLSFTEDGNLDRQA